MGFVYTIFPHLEGPVLISPNRVGDKRGFFAELYREKEFSERGIGPFVQENYSFSSKNVLRGLHYQKAPKEQGKLVQCVSGKIYDVAVDIRTDSPTFGKHVAVELEGANMLWIPPGFAHGFFALKDSYVLYRTTEYYDQELDAALWWEDADLDIRWPCNRYTPMASDKDTHAPLLKETFPEALPNSNPL